MLPTTPSKRKYTKVTIVLGKSQLMANTSAVVRAITLELEKYCGSDLNKNDRGIQIFTLVSKRIFDMLSPTSNENKNSTSSRLLARSAETIINNFSSNRILNNNNN